MTINSVIILVLASVGVPDEDKPIRLGQLEFFERKIRPVLAEHCYRCHNSVDKKKGDLALDFKGALLEAEVIVPGDPAKSPLIRAIRHEGDYEPMPYKSPKLAKLIIKNFEDWIRMGAPDPRLEKPTKEELQSQVSWEAVRDRRKEWWSFQPVKKTAPPEADDPEWNGGAIDRFIYAGLKATGLEPQKRASPGTLVRRLHLILTGLPPKPEVVQAFVADPSDAPYEKLVDELMASKRYGERWARYWMDWYRYAESHGSEGDPDIPYASQYRDYLIRAINADVPYDQLVREHIAGDLLENPRVNEELGLNESAIGPAHFRMVPHGFGVTDAYDEQITFTDNQIDVLSKAMLGLTVSCARCHNHKFDPISQEDYYKFYGIMISSRPAVVNVDSPALKNLHREKLVNLKAEIRKNFAAEWLGEIDKAIAAMESAKLDKIPHTDPLHGWVKLKALKPADLTRELQGMRSRYEEALKRNEEAKSRATFYADLRDQKTYDRWFKSGNGLGDKVSPAGSFALAGAGSKTFTGIYPAGVYSHLISDKHSGFLNSVFHLAKGERALARVIGSGALVRFCVRSYALSHGGLHPTRKLKPTIEWAGLGKYKYWNGEKGYYQINTAPDSTFKGKGARSWFGILEVYAGSDNMTEAGAPLVALPGDRSQIVDRASLLEFYRQSLTTAVSGWRDGKMTDADAQLLDAFVRRGFLANEVATLPDKLKSAVEAYRKLESEIRIPARAPGVAEGEPWDQPLLERGNYKKEKKPVPRGFLEVFPGKRYSKTESGRRELARDIVSERNTLTARVIVNRLWHHTFGRAIVASADNFGRLGKAPTHPELLDYLASDFRENGWSMKRTVRQLVLSRTFRSASTATVGSAQRDPENLLLAYYSPRRLDAEAILDSIRFVAANDIGRRAVYTRVKRNSLHPFLSTFNLPIPTSTVGVRNVTDVPAQSLTLMNGEITRNAAREWSQRVAGNPELKTDRERIEHLFLQAYSRRATAQELDACLAYIKGQAPDDTEALIAEHKRLAREVARLREERERVIAPVRERLQAEVDKKNAAATAEQKPVDLKPIGRWDFEGDAKDLVGGAHGELLGNARIEGGALVLRGGCVLTAPISKTLRAKSLEVLVQLDPLNQQGGGAMTVQTLDGNIFDGIVYAESEPRMWLAGSNFHRRTAPLQGPAEGDAAARPVRMVLVYHADGTIQAYRDGQPYGKPYKKSRRLVFRKGKAQLAFGLRHGKGLGGNRMLTGRIFEARLYDRALSAEEVAATASGKLEAVVTSEMLAAALTAPQKEEISRSEKKIASLTAEVDVLDREIANRQKLRESAGDPYYRIAHALLNSKELIYVY